MLAKVIVYLKEGILDPQGATVKKALENFGFRSLDDVRIGKYIEIKLNMEDQNQAKEKVDEMCKRLLANPVIENYKIEVMKD